MAEAGASQAQAQAETRAKSNEAKAMLFAKDGMTPSANNHAELFKLLDPCAKVVGSLGIFPEVGTAVMYQTLAGLVLDSDNLTDVSEVVANVNQALKRTAKHQVKAIGTNGTGMATDTSCMLNCLNARLHRLNWPS